MPSSQLNLKREGLGWNDTFMPAQDREGRWDYPRRDLQRERSKNPGDSQGTGKKKRIQERKERRKKGSKEEKENSVLETRGQHLRKSGEQYHKLVKEEKASSYGSYVTQNFSPNTERKSVACCGPRLSGKGNVRFLKLGWGEKRSKSKEERQVWWQGYASGWERSGEVEVENSRVRKRYFSCDCFLFWAWSSILQTHFY